MIKRENGFTIQEVLVAIIVGSLLVGFSLSAFLFVSRIHRSWQSRSDIEQTTGRTVQTITLDVLRSKAATVSDSMITLEWPGGRRVHYLLGNSAVTRNGVQLAPDSSVRVGAIVRSMQADNPIEIEVTSTGKDRAIRALSKARTKKSSKQTFLKDAAGL